MCLVGSMITRRNFIVLCVVSFFVIDYYWQETHNSLDIADPGFPRNLSEYDLVNVNKSAYVSHADFHNYTINFDECELEALDPWDASIQDFVDPNVDPMKTCIKKEIFTELVDGNLVFLRVPCGFCYWRCLNPLDDYNIDYGDWGILINNTRPDCDVVEVRCLEEELSKVDLAKKNLTEIDACYEYLHAQIAPKTSPLNNEKSKTPPPNVYIIVLDSVSVPQFSRSMVRTKHFLREELDVIPFPYMNKAHLNSRPNGYSFLFGKSMYSYPKSPVSMALPIDFIGDVCSISLDDEQFIGFQFRDAGYVTMMAEDWPTGVFNWPNCTGFTKTPTDHYMRPFQLRSGLHQKSTMAKRIFAESCRETFHSQMDYLQSFMDAYPGRPKFAVSWTSDLAHDDVNALYHVDSYFYEFLKKNKRHLQNSYFILMGDHGNRFGKIRRTMAGEREDNNPLFIMSFPSRRGRRESKMFDVVRANSKQLITHYDLYATFVDIARLAKSDLPTPFIRGKSLFAPLPAVRTCEDAGIPFEFCQCKPKNKRLRADNEIGVAAATTMLERVNVQLASNSVTRPLCSKLRLHPKVPVVAEQFESKPNASGTLLRITFTVDPGKGVFSGYVTYDQAHPENGFLILSRYYNRLNSYGAQAKCVIYHYYAQYCFCKEFL